MEHFRIKCDFICVNNITLILKKKKNRLYILNFKCTLQTHASGPACSCSSWLEVNSVCALHSGGQKAQRSEQFVSDTTPLSPFLMVCHCLFVSLKWQHSCIICVFLQHWHNTLPPQQCAIIHCDAFDFRHSGEDSYRNRWKQSICRKYRKWINWGEVRVKSRVSLQRALSNESITT